MLNEFKILINNIKGLRKWVLNEGVSDNAMADAINNHKIVHIYYAGDDTYYKGFRTIKPFVLGTHKKTGNKVVRAWQDAGSSDSYMGLNRKPRKGHEFDSDHKGRTKPGWRLFKLDDIQSMMPSGEKFNPRNIIDKTSGAQYNPNDQDMSGIVAAIQITPDQSTQTTGLDSPAKPDVTKQKVDKSTFDQQAPRFQRFFKAADKTREATKEEIDHLWYLALKQKKKSPKKLWVIQNEKGDMMLRDEKAVERLPQTAIVGNLDDLHKKYFRAGPTPTSFFDDVKNKTQKDVGVVKENKKK
jgi:hypothetical protein